MTHGNGWDRHQLLVLTKLDELEKDLKGIEEKVSAIALDIAMLKVKSGLWGATAGMIPAAVAFALTNWGS